MENKLIQSIKKVVKKVYPDEKFNDSVEALGDFLSLISSESKLKEKDLLSMLAGNSDEQDAAVVKWGNIEIVLKELCRTCFPEKYEQNGRDNVKLEVLYKEVFSLVPEKIEGRNFSIKAADPDGCRRKQETLYKKYRFIGEFVNLYKFRNADVTHSIDESGSEEISKARTDACVVLLHLSLKYSSVLHKKVLLQCFFNELSKSWVKECDKEYELMRNNIGYVDFKWQANVICSTEQIAYMNAAGLENERYIKLLGQAGSGKTTALIQINHLLLKQFAKTEIVPVFYELKNLSVSKESFLSYIVSEVFSVSEKAAESILETESLVFLLDGYNEILNIEIRRQFSKELERYAEDHGSVRIILTDRNEKNEITVLQNKSKCFRLQSFSDNDRADYFNRNCEDKNVLKLILEELKNNPARFEMLTTPLKLYHFTEMTVRSGKTPDDFTAEYLEEIIERERDEKKDPTLDALEDYLKALTVISGMANDRIERTKALAIMTKVDNLLGYFKNYNTAQALNLARDMGILREETIKPDGCRQKKIYYQFEDEYYLQYYTDLFYENEVLAENLLDSI